MSLELLGFYYTNAAIQVTQSVSPKSKYLLKVDSIANSLSMLNDTTIKERISNYIALIRAKDFNINLEEVNLPGKPCRMLIQHRNLNELYFRIYKFLPNDIDIDPGVEQENLVTYFLKQNPYRQWKDQWPESFDFNYHQVELKVDGLDQVFMQFLVLQVVSLRINLKLSLAIFNPPVSLPSYLTVWEMDNRFWWWTGRAVNL